MTMNLAMVTIDCAEPRQLATFWSEALGVPVTQDYEGEYLIIGDLGKSVVVALQRVPETKAGKNRVHLDFVTDDRVAEVARLTGLGAAELAEHQMPGMSWTVLADPEGNEFCVGKQD